MMRIKLVALSSPGHYSCWNSLSVETLAGDLRGYFGDRVSVAVEAVSCDASAEAITQSIVCDPVDILGFSVHPGTVDRCLQILRLLHQPGEFHSRQPLIVFGNKVPTYFPERFLRAWTQSVVVLGEAEHSFRELVEHRCSGGDLSSIPNLVFQRQGRTVRTFRELSSIRGLIYPPGLDTINRVLSSGGNALVQSSRGCSWSKCSFCITDSWRMGRGWEALPLDRVLSNVRQLAGTGISEIEFADDDFSGDFGPDSHSRLDELALGLKEIGHDCLETGHLTFRIFMNPHQVFRPRDHEYNLRVRQMLGQLKSAGLVKVYMGLDSGCSSQLQRYRRPASLAHVKGAMRVLRSLDIGIDVGFIMFDPLLTLEEMVENTGVFRRLGLIAHNQWPFRPMEVYPGTPIFAQLQSADLLRGEDRNFGSYSYEYSDRRIQSISQAVDLLSQPYRALFYALKSLSKRQYEMAKKDVTTLRAQYYVEQNGLVFLDLMEQCALALLDDHEDILGMLCERARERIHGLVGSIRDDISEGVIVDKDGFLKLQIRCLETLASGKAGSC